jgi:hypothetical protein
MKFDWQADEDKDWEGEQPLPEQPAVPPGVRRRRWLTLLLILVVVLGSGGLLYRQLQGQANERSETIKEDVFASYNVIWQTAQRQDSELFISLLSGRDPNWTEAQKELLAQGSLFDRRQLGLYIVPASRDVRSIELSPDLAEATLEANQLFQLSGQPAITITLRQTHIFRLGNRRWLLAPPEEEFWGSIVTQHGRTTVATYPQRDQEVAGRLARQLDALIEQLCDEVAGWQCPADMSVPLRFDSNPAALVALNNPTTFYDQRDIWLPAPTLVGVPLDEAGYQALYQGYATWITRWLMAQQVEWECCRRIVFFEALADRQLADLGARPPLLTPADYERFLDQPPLYIKLDNIWQMEGTGNLTTAEQQEVHGLLDYLLAASPETTALALQQRLTTQSTLWIWLSAFLETPGPALVAEQNWVTFAYPRSLSGNRPLPLPLPDDNMLLLCAGPQPSSTFDANLYRYQIGSDTWTTVLSDTRLYGMSVLPNDRGVVLSADFSPRSQTFLWRDGELQMVYDQAVQGPNWYFLSGDPAGRYLAMTASESAQLLSFALLDLNRCDAAGCQLTELPGWPTWSPDGSQMMLARWEDGVRSNLARADGDGRILQELSEDVSPFWLDNTTYGYLHYEQDGDTFHFTDIRVASVADDEARVWLTADRLAEQLDEGNRAEPLTVMSVNVNPADPNQIFVTTWQGESGEQTRSAVFAVDRQSGQPTLLFTAEQLVFGPPSFLEDGRWLLLRAISQGEPLSSILSNSLYLYDSEAGELKTVNPPADSSYGVSADGRWLWRTGQGLLYLYAPAFDYHYVIEHNQQDCQMAIAE